MTRVKVSLNFPILNTIEPLKHIANKVIIADIQDRMLRGKDVSGQSYRSLAESTTRRKRKLGLRTEPILASGQLRRSPKAIAGKNSVVITPAGSRYSVAGENTITNKELADILQNKGVRSKIGKRRFEFFGISREAELEAIDFMNKWVKKRIRIGGRRTIR